MLNTGLSCLPWLLEYVNSPEWNIQDIQQITLVNDDMDQMQQEIEKTHL